MQTTAVDPALRRSNADAERLGNLCVREAGQVPQNDGFSELEGKLGECRDDQSAQVSSLCSGLRARPGIDARGFSAFESGDVWMGFRPSLPDSLPVIGPSRVSNRIIYAFGHGHLGMTQAQVTAGLVADMIAGRPGEIDVSPFSAQRF